jgi:hypothetical protein
MLKCAGAGAATRSSLLQPDMVGMTVLATFHVKETRLRFVVAGDPVVNDGANPTSFPC